MSLDEEFDYMSSQDNYVIDEQIDLFEAHYYAKCRKTKQKIKKTPCPITKKTLKCQLTVLKRSCTNEKQTPKAQQKTFRYDHYPHKPKPFDCDEQFLDTSPSIDDENQQNFSSFRRHFYEMNHTLIKSSFGKYSNVQIMNIRPVSTNESIVQEFMEELPKTPLFPHLVYHELKLSNPKITFRYGFSVSNRNTSARFLSRTHRYSTQNRQHGAIHLSGLLCCNSNSSILACAAIYKRNRYLSVTDSSGHMYGYNNILRMIPLFIVDLRYFHRSKADGSWFRVPDVPPVNVKKKNEIPEIIPKKYLRKVLDLINDHERRYNQYQIRHYPYKD
ncbi:unnamed protein product [Adineta ricciae]|uniref:Uncharacterized protein n=1 Tax=Adineta ricciae TaxID=249248 RepID=A0A814FZ64_ADIRI|nr:unnamed protein product [Adineta ricciae]CAF1336014.1 unnamed protein product [Adineta ricciae]